jgi:hypothetical protein
MQGPSLRPKQRLHLSGWAAFIIATNVATLSPANADSLATRTMERCSDLSSYGPQVVDEFSSLGWAPVNGETRKDTLAVLADGLVIATGTYRQPNNWPQQIADAKKLTDLVEEPRPDLYTVFSGTENGAAAALIVLQLEASQVRCTYSGPTDSEMTSLIDILIKMDLGIGVSPADPAFEMGTITKASGDTTVSIQVARYTAIPVELGRVPLAEIGFSIIVTPGS